TTDVHRPPNAGCMWNWDETVSGDSLQGWWPTRFQWRYLSNDAALGTGDYKEAGGAIDIGNLTNYYPVHGRTTGVVGVWHRDPGGDPTGLAGNSNGVTWVPLQGSNSAWCGLRN